MVWSFNPFGTLGRRLTLSFGLITGAALIVLGSAGLTLWNARASLTSVAEDQIPRLNVAADMARSAMDVARLANTLPTSIETLSQANEPQLQAVTEQILDLSEAAFDLSGKSGSEAVGLTSDLSLAIGNLQALRLDYLRSQERIAGELTRLRWLNVDIQDEVESLSNDVRFNISGDLDGEAGASEVGFQLDRFNTLQRLGSFAATAVTLLLQAAVTPELDQLETLSGLVDEALGNVLMSMSRLPDRSDYVTLRHSVENLRHAAKAPEGLLQATLATARERQQTEELFEQVQNLTSRLHGIFLEASDTQRLVVVGKSRDLVDQSTRGVVVIIGLVVSTALFALALLVFYVYPGIVHPLTRLTATLLAISKGEKVEPVSKTGRDEIAQMYRAVDVFRASIKERERAGDLLREEIAEHRRTLEELRHTQADLIQAAKMAAIGELSAGLSHELNQPINAMQHRLWSFGKLLDEDRTGLENKELRERVTTLQNLVQRMSAIVGHFKRFARRTKPDLGRVSVSEALKGAEGLIGHRLAETGVELGYGSDLEAAEVVAEVSLLEQILLNLLTNAIDAMENLDPERPRIIRVEVVSSEHDEVNIVVSDTGDGLGEISPDEAMTPFVTKKDPGQGMGLGLAISYRIARDLGGSLRLRSGAAGGTSAVLRLRRAEHEAG